MRASTEAVARLVGACCALVALVVGPPLLLVRLVGNPFPGELPSVDEIRILLTQQGQGFTNFLIGVLAVLIWWLWAQLVVALIAEIVATIRQAETRRLPTIPGIQAVAARLIAAITLATTLATAPLMAPAVGALTFDDVAASPALSTAIAEVGSFAATPSAATPSAAMPSAATPSAAVTSNTIRSNTITDMAPSDISASFVMSEHTELWDLAEAAYGDGISWKLIAQANAGLHDSNGVMITNETESVAAGTRLAIPGAVASHAVAGFVDGADSVAAEPVIDRHLVAPGDSMWTVAQGEVERRLDRSASDTEVGAYWHDVVAANQDISSGDVDLIHPGEELVLPADPAAAVTIEAPRMGGDTASDDTDSDDTVMETAESMRTSDPTRGTAGVVDGPADNATGANATSEDTSPNVPDPPDAPDAPVDGQHAEQVDTSSSGGRVSAPAAGMAALGAAMLSAGVIGALRRRRDLQRRTRPAGAMARPASTTSAAFEAALAHSSDELRESQIGLGWRMLPASALASARAAGPLELHAHESGRLTAVPIVDSEAGWKPHEIDLEPSTTVDDVHTVLGDLASAAEVEEPEIGAAAVPTTTVIGTETPSGEAVLLDLASVGMLDLQGETNDVRRVARGVILDLAVSDRCDDLCVIGVDVGLELDDLERVHSVTSFPEALAQVVHCGHAGVDSATPVVVVSATAPSNDDQSVSALRELNVLIVAPGLDTATKLAIDGDTATLLPAGTHLAMAAFDDGGYRSVAELIDTTSTAAIEFVDVNEPVEAVLDVLAVAGCLVEPGPVEVRVLGPVSVMGAGSFSSLKAVDIVTYLAFHRHGVDADQIKSWVWPAFDPPTDKAFANVMSRARTGLGADDDGAPYLSRAGADKTYRLGEAVTTDFDRFRAFVELADAAPEPSAALALLKGALELIRGVPFTGGAASSFAWADNHVRARVEYTIDESVHRCADLALDLGDLPTARWAVLKGLELVPGCEQCFRRRFLIASAGKNRSELRRAMADLEASAMIDLGEAEAIDMISGDLLDLYRELDQALVAGSR